MSGLNGLSDDNFEQLGYACDPKVSPTIEAIGELIAQAFAHTRSLREAT